eukprot:scaffold3057_cov163-Ochromonas_danica.AAC.12
MGISTSTPGLTGDDRFEELAFRLKAAQEKLAKTDLQASDNTLKTSPVARNDNDFKHLTIGELRSRLAALGESTSTPGLTGDDRWNALLKRLITAICGNDTSVEPIEKPKSAAKNREPPKSPPPSMPESKTEAVIEVAEPLFSSDPTPTEVVDPGETADISEIKKQIKRIGNKRAIIIAGKFSGDGQDPTLKKLTRSLELAEADLTRCQSLKQCGDTRIKAGELRSSIATSSHGAAAFRLDSVIGDLEVMKSELREMINRRRQEIREEAENHEEYGLGAEESLREAMSQMSFANTKISRARRRLQESQALEQTLRPASDDIDQANTNELVVRPVKSKDSTQSKEKRQKSVHMMEADPVIPSILDNVLKQPERRLATPAAALISVKDMSWEESDEENEEEPLRAIEKSRKATPLPREAHKSDADEAFSSSDEERKMKEEEMRPTKSKKEPPVFRAVPPPAGPPPQRSVLLPPATPLPSQSESEETIPALIQSDEPCEIIGITKTKVEENVSLSVRVAEDRNEVSEEEVKKLRKAARELERGDDFLAAELLLQRALEVDPINIPTLQTFAVFLHKRKGELARAEAFFNRALQLCMPGVFASISSPKHSVVVSESVNAAIQSLPDPSTDRVKLTHAVQLLLSFSNFMVKAKGDIEAAHRLLQKALQLAPEDATVVATTAHFLDQFALEDEANAQKRSAKVINNIDTLFREALRRRPGYPGFMLWYAHFLKRNNRLGPAELMYKSATVAARGTTWEPAALCNYATFLFKQRKKQAESQELFEKALEQFPVHKGLRKNYAQCLKRGESRNCRSGSRHSDRTDASVEKKQSGTNDPSPSRSQSRRAQRVQQSLVHVMLDRFNEGNSSAENGHSLEEKATFILDQLHNRHVEAKMHGFERDGEAERQDEENRSDSDSNESEEESDEENRN